MEQNHRDALQKNRLFLLDNITELECLIDHLMEHSIITSGMQQQIMAEKTEKGRVRALIDILPKRGPQAFQLFLDGLKNTKQSYIARKLDPSIDKSSGPEVVPPEELSAKAQSVSLKESNKTAITKNQSGVRPSQPMSYNPSGKSSGKSASSPQSVPLQNPVPSGKPCKSASSPPPTPGTSGVTSPSSAGLAGGKSAAASGKPTCQPSADVESLSEASQDWPKNVDVKISSSEFYVQFGTAEEVNELLSSPSAYKMDGKKICTIINNRKFKNEAYEDRSNSDMDSFRIQSVLNQLGFSHRNGLKTDLAGKDFLETLKTFAEKMDDTVCMFVLVILSYGGNGTVMCTDGKMVMLQDIVDQFSSQNCRALQGKPKLILIQACGAKFKDIESRNLSERDGGDPNVEHILLSLSKLQLGPPAVAGGDSAALGASENMTDTKGSPDQNVIPTPALDVSDNSDILVAMATTPDESSFEYRSLFILSLSYILCKYSKSHHFVQLIQMVNRLKLVENQPIDLCQFKHSFQKDLYLAVGK